MKALISDNDRILGFTAFGFEAGELLPAVQLAMAANLPYTAIRSLIVTHPTISEGLVGLFSAVPPLTARRACAQRSIERAGGFPQKTSRTWQSFSRDAKSRL